jgi:MBG domain (YGX type)
MFHGAMERRLKPPPRMSTKTNRQRTCPPLRIVAVVAAAVAALSLAVVSPALADSPIQNPFFKDTSVSGTNSGTNLSGWGTSAPGQQISTYCYVAGGQDAHLCTPEQGTTIPVVGLAGSPAPTQAFMAGGQGTSGAANKSFRSTDIYNTDSDWLSENPAGNLIPQQSNYSLIPTSCRNNQPAPNTLSQTFYANKDQIITGFSFFTSQDWVPDSGTVTITPPGGSPQPVYRSRITGDNDASPAGSWDHPVPPTVHQLNSGTWVMPHGDPATSTWIAQHQAGVSGTPWTRWTYRFPQDGNYTITATANESTDPSFPIDCNMPSMMGLQFQTPTPIKDGLTIATTPTSATYGDAPFSIANKASVSASRTGQSNPTGKGVQFSTTDPDCSVTSGGTVTVKQVGDGTCNVTVRAPGNFYFYAPESKNLPITINPRTLHVDAPDLGKTYGSANPDPTPQATLRQSDFVGGDTLATVLNLANSGQPNCSIDSSAGPDVGAYAGTIHCGAGTLNLATSGGNRPNYTLQSGRDGTLTITRANQTINLPSLSDRTVGDPNVDPGATATSGLSVAYASVSPSVCTITGDGKIQIQHAGTCAIIASQPGSNNYNPATSVPGTFNVAKANQTIAFNSLSDKGFGDGDFTINAGATSQLPVTFSTSTPDVCSVDTNTGVVHILGSGDCMITASQGGNEDYNGAPDVTQKFHIATAGQAITFPALSDKTWGDQDVNLGATANSGLPVSYTAQGNCQLVNGKVHITGAGSCTVTANQGGDQRYSSAPPVSRTFQINPAQLTVKAADKSKTYGDANPSFTYGVTGFVNGDTLSSATSGAASCSSNAGQGSGAGNYGISCSQGALQVSPNYNVQFADGTLTVNKAQLTVKADDKSKTYGGSNPNFTYGISGFLNGDTQASATNGSASCSSNGGQGAGTYAINCGQGSLAASNYSFNYSPGTLTVGKAQLTVKANDQSKNYGDSNPNFTYGVNGLVNGDTQASATSGSASCSANAGQGSDVGSYPINCGQGSLAASNYNLNYSPGTLVVNPANQSINLGSIDDKFFGQDDFNASANATSGLPVTYSASGDCAIDPSTGKIHLQLPSSWPGNCTVTASQNGNNDYNAAQSVSRSFKLATAAVQGGGIFDIGNLDAAVGNNVNWWGSQWSKQNDLTSGPAPDAFKGYIDNISSYPPQCGTTWTTRPGNSSKPPDSVPQYMTVVVSSNVAKSGSSITGDVQSVVVVKTSSGYDSNPGHWGNGTVVAKLCGQKLNQSINFSQPSDKTITDADFDAGASSSSNLPVSYSSQTPSVCDIVNGSVDVSAVGDCTITASQGGNDVYSAAAPVTRTFKVTAISPLSCTSGKKSKTSCESVLVNPSPGANATVTAGQKLTIGYTDDSPIPTTGSLAPTAVLSDGRSLPVTVTPTSGLPYNYVTNYKQDRNNRNQSLLSFQLPANLTSGSYTIMVTANDGDGDVDQWSWPVRVN